MNKITHKAAAAFFRRISSSRELDETLLKAVKVLAEVNIPHLVVGGYAVQEHGYPRFTGDVDIVVSNVAEARDILIMRGFKAPQNTTMIVTDRSNGVQIDLLPGGGSIGPGPVSFPFPTQVSGKPQIAKLPVLISLKLSSYMGNKLSRHQDYSDVIELIKVNRLSRDCPVDRAVQQLYKETWDGLAAPNIGE